MSRYGQRSRPSSAVSTWGQGEPPTIVNYLVVAGGGGSGGASGDGVTGSAGGGAGGLRTSSGTTGGGGTTQEPITMVLGTNYTVTIGAGGSLGTAGNNGTNGNNSVFATVTSTGGGKGRKADDSVNADGGSGGGASGSGGAAAGNGTANEGFAGGTKNDVAAGSFAGGGGGGAGGAGSGRTRGVGVSNSLSGSAVTYAEGGYGQGTSNNINAGVAGTANRGNGANGASNGGNQGAAGGSGIVILTYNKRYVITIGAGLTGTTSFSDSTAITQITAGSGNVSWT